MEFWRIACAQMRWTAGNLFMLRRMKWGLGPVLGGCLVFGFGAYCAAAAVQPPPAYVSALESALQDDTSYRMRLQAAVLLGRTGASRACAPLVEALEQDPHLVVRAGAAMALGALRDLASVAPLCEQAARDPEPLVRQEALQALDCFATNEVALTLSRVYAHLPKSLQGPLLDHLVAAAKDGTHARLQRAAVKMLKDFRENRRPS